VSKAIIVHLRGYSPESATRCTTYADGKCLGELMPHGALVTWDTAIAPVSGEHAMIRLPRLPGDTDDILTTKQLEHFAGRWFMGFVDGWLELDRGQSEVLGKVVRIIRYPLSRVLVAEDEVIPPGSGYRQHLARTLREVDALTRKYGLDRTTAYPMKTAETDTDRWAAYYADNRWGIPKTCGAVGGLSAHLVEPFVTMILMLLSPLVRRLALMERDTPAAG
jgi:hypothetical protein